MTHKERTYKIKQEITELKTQNHNTIFRFDNQH